MAAPGVSTARGVGAWTASSVGGTAPWRVDPAHCVQYPGNGPGCCSLAPRQCRVWWRPTLSRAGGLAPCRRRFRQDTGFSEPSREYPQADRGPTTVVPSLCSGQALSAPIVLTFCPLSENVFSSSIQQ